jgi:hypothetical protein
MNKRNKLFRRSFQAPFAAVFVALFFFTLSFAGIAARAAGDWRDKDPHSWDQKDVQKILSDSPWSKQLSLGMAADGSLSQSAPAVGTSGVSETSGTAVNGKGPDRGLSRTYDGPTGAPGNFGPAAKFTVSWRSSRTIRQALLREKELSGASLDQAQKDLDAKYDAYQISITGPNLRAFVKEGAASLKTHSYLMTKSTKQLIAPSNIIIQAREDGTLVAVLFEFPRKNAAGEPSIAPNEKSVEFAAKVGNLPLKVTFDVSKMSTKEGPDL